MKKLSAAVIGLGKIGQLYDYQDRRGKSVMTHANAFYHHPAFDLIAGVDKDVEARKKFERKFKKPSYGSIKELYDQQIPEIVSLCVPTLKHFSIFKKIISHSPRSIICEKPIAPSLKEAKEMKALAEKKNCILLVNYMRRFEPGVLVLKEKIDRKELGEVYKGIVWYTKGLLNNGSHFIDLLMFLFGPVKEAKVLNRGNQSFQGDPEPDFEVCFDKLKVYFLSGRYLYYSLNTIELMGTEGSIIYMRGGQRIFIKTKEPNTSSYIPDHLEFDGTEIPNGMNRYQFYVLDGLYKTLIQGDKLNSNALTAIETLSVVEKIKRMIKKSKGLR